MVIKVSAAAEIRALIDALGTGDEVRREAAVARLGVIGPRAVDRLIAAYAEADPATRRALLRALEPMEDPRALPLARQALHDEAAAAPEAAAVLRRLLTAAGDTAAGALDALMSAALNPAAPAETRQVASEALTDIPADVRAEVAAAIGAASGRRTGGVKRADGGVPAARTLWTEALAGRLPDRPDLLQPLVATQAASASLTGLQKLVDLVRAREEDAADRGGWTRLRGALHQALALRGSRVALYDLRESLVAATTPLPVSFVAALHAAGDASCLDAIGQAYARADSSETWWRDHLAAAFQAIMQRETLTRRSAAVKRVLDRWPAAAALAPGDRRPRR